MHVYYAAYSGELLTIDRLAPGSDFAGG